MSAMPMTPVHFSDLKQFARSPAHYHYAVTSPRETTRPMRVGTLFDRLVLGGRYAVFSGDRRGTKWETWSGAQLASGFLADELFTESELDDARGSAESVLAHPFASKLIADGRKQVPITWSAHGLPRATRGVDLLGDAWLADIKSTHCTEPEQFSRHAMNQLWHAQLADYRIAVDSIPGAVPIRDCYLIGVEPTPPHVVTVLRVPDQILDMGAKSIALWSERLRGCLASGSFPGYVQDTVEMQLPAWMAGFEADS